MSEGQTIIEGYVVYESQKLQTIPVIHVFSAIYRGPMALHLYIYKDYIRIGSGPHLVWNVISTNKTHKIHETEKYIYTYHKNQLNM